MSRYSEEGIHPAPDQQRGYDLDQYGMGGGEAEKKGGAYINNSDAMPSSPTVDGDKERDLHAGPEKLHRTLKSRQASMLALGAAIGTGLIIGSGAGLAHAGPVSLFIAYVFVGSLCFAMLAALGEMSAFLPHQRGFAGHATRFVGPTFGAATGWAYWIKYLIQPPTQFSACAVIINYWLPNTKVNNGVWIAIFLVLTGCLQFMPVWFFGEFEFWCSTIKVFTLTGLMIMALVIDAGGGPNHEYSASEYTWKQLPFVAYLAEGSLGRFLGFWTAVVSAVYSYTESEMVGVAVGEMKNPSKSVSRAVKACFFRVVFLYCGSIFCIGLVVPADSDLLLAANSKSTNANASPFVVAINVAGIKVLPHIINAITLIFVISAANSDIYTNSRTSYALADEGNLPQIFKRTNRWGTPWFSVLFTMSFSLLAFTATKSSAYKIFNYFVSTVTLISTIVWMQIMYSHLRMMKACKRQGIARSDLPYASRFNPWMSIWGISGTMLISVTKGFAVFIGGFDYISFITNYIAFPAVAIAYVAFYFKYRSWYIPLDDIDLVTGTRRYSDVWEDEEDEDDFVRRKGIMGVWDWIKYAWNS